MLILSRKKDERIIIGDKIEVFVVDIRGDQVKLGIKAPDQVKVYRQEVYEAIQKENIEASRAATGMDLSKLEKLFPLDKKEDDKS